MLQLIVNGDDFGFSETINDAILKCFKDGILCSTSLMANGKSFEHAVGIIRSNPNLDVGVHLTLVEGKPISDSNKLLSILDNNGQFHTHANEFAKKYFSDKISLEEIRIELTAQIEKILDEKIEISHIDSHQHIHLLPKILDIVVELSNRYKIKFIRYPKEQFKSYMFRDLKSIDRIGQMVLINILCSKATDKIPYKTDNFGGFYFGGKLDKKNLLTIVNCLPVKGSYELMCHPGITDDPKYSTYKKYQIVEEMFALVDNEVKEVLANKNVEVTSFRNLIN